MKKVEDSNYDGLGFSAYEFKLLYQIVDNNTDRPLTDSWKEYDFTNTNITGNLGESIDPLLLENQSPTSNGFILDKGKDTMANIFSLIEYLDLPALTQPENLQFGDERFMFGNVDTYIGSSLFKTIFEFNIDSTKYTTTSNPTRDNNINTNPPELRVTELGVYDENKELVIIGKISKPITLKPNRTITIEASIDF